MGGGGFRDHPENINRNGRPKKGETFTDVIELELSKKNVQIMTESGQTLISAKEAVARKLIELAVSDKCFPAIKYIVDRIDGSPRQSISLGRDDVEMTPHEINEYIKIYERELSELEKVRASTKSTEAESEETSS